MRGLSRAQRQEKDALQAKLRDAHAALEAATRAFNEAMEGQARDDLETAVEAYNQAVSDARRFAQEEVLGEMSEYSDGRTDGWRDSDAGAVYQEWMDSWEGWEAEEVEPEYPEPLEAPPCPDLDELADRPGDN